MAEVAAAFVCARQKGRGLSSFPGPMPASLDDAYTIQMEAIALWPHGVVGWKVGRLTPDLAQQYGVDRFIGPIFADGVSVATKKEEYDFPVYVGGSAAFEAEYVAVMGRDQPTGPAEFDQAAARALVGELRVGIEVAGSPLAIMGNLDSRASIADFGNNNGLIVGGLVPREFLDRPDEMTCATTIDEVPIKSASAAALPGGPLTAMAFALTQAARLGMPLRAGQYVSTGAVTGMHWVKVGQRCVANFGAFGSIACLAVPMRRC